jgi:L-2,4-diaminobutyric acid acetyltransferase
MFRCLLYAYLEQFQWRQTSAVRWRLKKTNFYLDLPVRPTHVKGAIWFALQSKINRMVDRFSEAGKAEPAPRAAVTIRRPRADDGAGVHALIARCRPLDENSMYCNLLQCTHFADTCALAEQDGAIRGFVSGYLVPDAPERLFVWQVAVAPEARGQALGRRLIEAILSRPHSRGVREVHTSITPDNGASQALFTGLARRLKAPITRRVMFDRARHFAGRHTSEELWMIGPIGAARAEPLRGRHAPVAGVDA